MRREAILWIGILVSPVIWFLSLEANFALAPLACSGQAQGKLLLYLVSGVSLILTAIAAALSYTEWQTSGQNAPGEQMHFWPRRRAMALAGMGLSGLAFLVIIAQAIPTLMLAGCE